MRKFTLLAVAVGAMLAALPASASATVYSGTCQMEGTLQTPEYSLVIHPRDYFLRATGSCTGTLDGAPYDGPAAVTLDGRMQKPMSCFTGFSNDVPGTITFGSDPDAVGAKQIDFTVTETHGGTVLVFYMAGAFNGQAVGRLELGVGEEEFRKCLTSHVDSAPVVFSNQTITPLYG
ncbi:MAG TPA: hypothetical protein VF520_08470 [Thermoleophilaceae bacterium]|jgi:hypothetical protein